MAGCRIRHPLRWFLLLALGAFLAWRFLRPLHIFVIAPAFERPVVTAGAPAVLGDLHAETCGRCHPAFFAEWRTSIHRQAWDDDYFQADWRFDGREYVCRNCHTPLDRQQPRRLLGFRDRDKWDPILATNRDFDRALQHQGVTCAACHLRQGRILGPYAGVDAPHPVARLEDPNQVCLRCHVVDGRRWDNFYRFPPCGTVAELEAGRGEAVGRSGETRLPDLASLGCVQCHMPLVERPLVPGGQVRRARRHLWRGGHDPAMVRRALAVELQPVAGGAGGRAVRLVLTNVGAGHALPTGTPDRHLTLDLEATDAAGRVVASRHDKLIRRVLWRPFIVDLWDSRLLAGRSRRYRLNLPPAAVAVEARVRYHLLEGHRQRRIGYHGRTPVAFDIYHARLRLQSAAGETP